jgi:sugar O-acyltransferase (sialic acid O-acetyltransferase NeuD family)
LKDKPPRSQLVILGAGGDAQVVAEAIRRSAEDGAPVELIGFLDDTLKNQQVAGLPVFGGLDDWPSLPADVAFIPAIQKVKDMPRRAARLESLGIPAERWARVIHPSAVIARDAHIGHGVYIAACATVQPGCRIGNFATLRASAALGHDAAVEDHGYVGPNATLCGRTVVQYGAHLGPNAVVLDGRTVGRFAVVGIGTAVTKSVADYSVVLGNPGRRVGRVKP